MGLPCTGRSQVCVPRCACPPWPSASRPATLASADANTGNTGRGVCLSTRVRRSRGAGGRAGGQKEGGEQARRWWRAEGGGMETGAPGGGGRNPGRGGNKHRRRHRCTKNKRPLVVHPISEVVQPNKQPPSRSPKVGTNPPPNPQPHTPGYAMILSGCGRVQVAPSHSTCRGC